PFLPTSSRPPASRPPIFWASSAPRATSRAASMNPMRPSAPARRRGRGCRSRPCWPRATLDTRKEELLRMRPCSFVRTVAKQGKSNMQSVVQDAKVEARTEIRDGMRITWHQPIEMDDGLVLRADVFRPIADGRYPVILTYGVYAKGLSYQEG